MKHTTNQAACQRHFQLAIPSLALLSLTTFTWACGGEADEAEARIFASSATGHGSTDDSEAEAATAQRTKIRIPTRVFSASPSLGAKPTSTSDHHSPDYAALAIFFDKVTRSTKQQVAFEITPWAVSSSNTIIQQVGLNDDPDANGVARDAAYDAGGALNPTWGFVFNSTPFGLEFDLMLQFLYDHGGLSLAQSIVDKRGLNVKLLPVVGSNPQGSGYLKQPIGKAQCEGERDCLRQAPIGLAGLCQAGWTWRFLPPAQLVLDGACDQLVKEGLIPTKKITFVSSVGGLSTLGAVQQGAVTAFEFATPLDDYDPPTAGNGYFPPLSPAPIAASGQNPGHKGLRFAHYPSWHQPFFIGWMMVNKSAVWDRLPHRHQAAIERAAREAVEESYWYSKSLQRGALEKILDHNDGQVQLDTSGAPILVNGRPVSADIKLATWPDDALARLQKAADAYLESLKGGDTPTVDQQDYTRVITALRAYMKRINYHWDQRNFDYAGDCRR